MNPALSLSQLTFPPHPSVSTSSRTALVFSQNRNISTKAAASSPDPPNPPHASISLLKSVACAALFAAAAAAFGNFHHFPARAEISTPLETLAEDLCDEDSHQLEGTTKTSPLTQFLESNSEALDALKELLQRNLDAGEDEESLTILRKLSAAEPHNTEWKFLIARLLNEMGKIEEARVAFEEILSETPLSFEALFENALLMDRSGDREGVMRRLEDALNVAETEKKMKEAREVRLIMAQMQFLHKNVDEAMRSYNELVKEDPADFRPYFCKGMIYSLMDKNSEAREQFAKYRELSPKKFEVEGYLRTPLSRMKLFGTDEENRS